MRLPAARRFAATTLRAMITGSVNFISNLVFEAIATERFYRIAAEHILRPAETHPGRAMPVLEFGDWARRVSKWKVEQWMHRILYNKDITYNILIINIFICLYKTIVKDLIKAQNALNNRGLA